MSALTILGSVFRRAMSPTATTRPSAGGRRRANGSYMLDIAFGSMAAAAIVASTYGNSGNITNQANGSTFISQIASLQKQMAAANPTGYTVGTYTATVLINNAIVPSGFQNGATALKHPWSTASDAITVAGVTTSTNSITIKYLPQGICSQLMRSLTTTTGVTQVAVNGGTAITTLPADTSVTSGACSNSAPTNIVAITST